MIAIANPAGENNAKSAQTGAGKCSSSIGITAKLLNSISSPETALAVWACAFRERNMSTLLSFHFVMIKISEHFMNAVSRSMNSPTFEKTVLRANAIVVRDKEYA